MLANNKIKIDSKLARESAIQDGESNDRLTKKTIVYIVLYYGIYLCAIFLTRATVDRKQPSRNVIKRSRR